MGGTIERQPHGDDDLIILDDDQIVEDKTVLPLEISLGHAFVTSVCDTSFAKRYVMLPRGLSRAHEGTCHVESDANMLNVKMALHGSTLGK